MLESIRWRTLVGVATGSLIQCISTPLAVASMGAGHGSYFYVKLFFPLAMIALNLLGEIPIWLALLSLLQYPLYGAFIASAKKDRTVIMLTIVLCIHLLSIAVAVFLGGESA